MSSNTSDDEVFQYTGRETIPKDVTIVSFDCSVVDVEEQTFRECKKLKEVVLNSGLQTIGQGAFLRCSSLECITLPPTVTDIDSFAFHSCKSLRDVVLNEGLTTIGNRAFEKCSSIESITIPSTVIEINRFAFSKFSLKEVVFKDGLEKLGHGVFSGCCSLESITVPSSVVEIGSHVFHACINLREVVCIERLPMIKSKTFDGCPVLERITFPHFSSRLEDIIRAGQLHAQTKVQQYINRGVIEWERGGTICIPVEVTTRREGCDLVNELFHQIVDWIKHYEMKEGTTIFELALWKAKIDQVEDDINIHRDACRIDVPGPVKDSIRQYLDL